MIKQEFEVLSLTAIGTDSQDADVGVIRVSRDALRQIGKRNALVKVTNSSSEKSIIRIVRAKTGSKALKNGQVALQYDDRLVLGIPNANSRVVLHIRPANDWLALPGFLLGHSSPLVRKEALFGLAMAIIGAVFGTILGFTVSLVWTG